MASRIQPNRHRCQNRADNQDDSPQRIMPLPPAYQLDRRHGLLALHAASLVEGVRQRHGSIPGPREAVGADRERPVGAPQEGECVWHARGRGQRGERVEPAECRRGGCCG